MRGEWRSHSPLRVAPSSAPPFCLGQGVGGDSLVPGQPPFPPCLAGVFLLPIPLSPSPLVRALPNPHISLWGGLRLEDIERVRLLTTEQQVRVHLAHHPERGLGVVADGVACGGRERAVLATSAP